MISKQISSPIKHWWIAEEKRKMAFENILSKEQLIGKYLVVGYHEETQCIITSTSYVKEINNRGVKTSKGVFFSFEDCNNLYIQFLIEASKKKSLIAENWKFVNSSKSKMLADIISNDQIEENVEFDFISDSTRMIVFSGYSKQLNSKVIVNTFDRRGLSVETKVPEEIQKDIYLSSFFI